MHIASTKDSFLMFYLLVSIIEFFIFLLIFLAGFRVYKLYSNVNIRFDKSEIEDVINNKALENHHPLQQKAKKTPNEALHDYIGDFF